MKTPNNRQLEHIHRGVLSKHSGPGGHEVLGRVIGHGGGHAIVSLFKNKTGWKKLVSTQLGGHISHAVYDENRTNEEADMNDINELSKKTLKSYAKKADAQAQRAWDKAAREEDKSMATDGMKYPEKQKRHMDNASSILDVWRKRDAGSILAKKKIAVRDRYLPKGSVRVAAEEVEPIDERIRGIKMATDKLTREENEMDEGITVIDALGKTTIDGLGKGVIMESVLNEDLLSLAEAMDAIIREKIMEALYGTDEEFEDVDEARFRDRSIDDLKNKMAAADHINRKEHDDM